MLRTSSSANLRTEASGIFGSVVGVGAAAHELRHEAEALRRHDDVGVRVDDHGLCLAWFLGCVGRLADHRHGLQLQPHAVLQVLHDDVPRGPVVPGRESTRAIRR